MALGLKRVKNLLGTLLFEGHAFLDPASLGEPKEASSSLSKNVKARLQSKQAAKWLNLAATSKWIDFWYLKKIKR